MHKKFRLWFLTAAVSTEFSNIIINRLITAPTNWERTRVTKLARSYLAEAFKETTELQTVEEVTSVHDIISSILCVDGILSVDGRLSVEQLLTKQQRFLDISRLPLWQKFRVNPNVNVGWLPTGRFELAFTHRIVADDYEVGLHLTLTENVEHDVVNWTKGELTIEKRFNNGKVRRSSGNLTETELANILRESPTEVWQRFENEFFK